MRRILFLFSISSFLALSASCGGLTIDPKNDGGTPASTGSGGSTTGSTGTSSGGAGGSTGGGGSGGSEEAGNSTSTSSGGTGGGVFDGGRCPVASREAVTSVAAAAAAAAVAGSWQVCTGLPNVLIWGPSDTVGMEFAAATSDGGSCAEWGGGGTPCMGGNIYFLVAGPAGLVRGQGSSYQIYYAVFGVGMGLELALNHTPTNGNWTTAISASASPRVLDIESTGYNSGATLVAVH